MKNASFHSLVMEFKGRRCGKDIGIFSHEKGQKMHHCYSFTQLLHYKPLR